tara:strand:+ start:1667 stop:2545 length:879 start_codon:yes stop_codon:yes gene_type:complete
MASSIGRGECFPYARYGETMESVENQIESVIRKIEKTPCRQNLSKLLPPGAARNAIDCALWDLEAKMAQCRVWELARLPFPRPLTTVFTLGVDNPSEMGARALENKSRPYLKLKMTGDGFDLERVEKIHANAPTAKLVVDANEGWSIDQYVEYAPKFRDLGVEMIEQPLPAAKDDDLASIDRPIPVCADESCHDTDTLEGLIGKYDMINIKLDKSGGLTEALRLKEAALHLGFDIMVGCMIGTSLAMAPGLIVGQGASIVDLDGPLLLQQDRECGLEFNQSTVNIPAAELWG